ncbi:hypothetical protein G6F61_013863 [Rhizopus arrhizus]|nr:hypothetical protein G6F61_013863 [Rhizopus arrhizus]
MEGGDLVVVVVGGDERLRGEQLIDHAHARQVDAQAFEVFAVRAEVRTHGAHRDRLAAQQVQVVGDVAGIHVRAHQQVRFALQGGRRQDAHAQRFVQRAVAVHFAVDFQIGRFLTHDFQGAAHLGARGRAARSEVRPR